MALPQPTPTPSLDGLLAERFATALAPDADSEVLAWSVTGLRDGRVAVAIQTSEQEDAVTGEVRILQTDPSQAPDAVFRGHPGLVRSLLELSDGRIVSGGADGLVMLWDPDDINSEPATFDGHSDIVIAMTELSDGRIASASFDQTVQIWDPATPSTAAVVYRGHTDAVTAVIQLFDGRLATASIDQTVRIWAPSDPQTTEVVYDGHRGGVLNERVFAIRQLPDGRLVSGGADGMLLWDPAAPNAEKTELIGPALQVLGLEVLSDGRIASVGGLSVQVFTVTDEPSVVATYPQADRSPLGPLDIAQLNDGRIVTAGWDIMIWDPTEDRAYARTITQGNTEPATALLELASGQMVSGTIDGRLIAWERDSPEVVKATTPIHTRPIDSLVELPNGYIASAGLDAIHIWDLRDLASPVATYTGHGQAAVAALGGPTGQSITVAVLADGRLASAGDDNAVHIWDPANPDIATIETVATGTIETVIALSDGRIAVAGESGTVLIWHPDDDSRFPSSYQAHTDTVTALVELPGGLIASASVDSSVRIWDPNATGTGSTATLGGYRGHADGVWGLALLDNGLVVSDGGREMHVWDPASPGVTLDQVDVSADDLLGAVSGGEVGYSDRRRGVLTWIPRALNPAE